MSSSRVPHTLIHIIVQAIADECVRFQGIAPLTDDDKSAIGVLLLELTDDSHAADTTQTAAPPYVYHAPPQPPGRASANQFTAVKRFLAEYPIRDAAVQRDLLQLQTNLALAMADTGADWGSASVSAAPVT